MTYGPELTPRMKSKLQKEIDNFDKTKTKAEIKKNAVGGPDVNAYQHRLEKRVFESNEANPDQLGEQEGSFPWATSTKFDSDVEIGKSVIKDLLSPMQWKVWRFVMIETMTQAETAWALRVTQQTVSAYLKAAIRKVKKHFDKKDSF